MNLNCGCTWTKRCWRHSKDNPEKRRRIREAEQKDAELRRSGALPSPEMYVLSMSVVDEAEEHSE